MEKNKFRTGAKTLEVDEFAPKHTTIMISVKMEPALLKDLKAYADNLGRPYQTVMKMLIREGLDMKHPSESLMSSSEMADAIRGLQEQIDRITSSTRRGKKLA